MKFENKECIWINLQRKLFVIMKEGNNNRGFKSYKNIERILKIAHNKGLPIYIVSYGIKKCFYTSPYPLIFSTGNKKSHKLIDKFETATKHSKLLNN